MASHKNTTGVSGTRSAKVIPFNGKWQGDFELAPFEGRAACRALHDARIIRAAREANDDWTARLLLALLQTLDTKQLERLEFSLLNPDALTSKSAVQALAIVQSMTGDKSHRERLKAALEAFARRERE